MFRMVFCLLMVFQASSCISSQQAQVVVLVRHAEKAAEPSSDPVLTEQGVARARALLDRLENIPIDQIITSQLARTRLTAQFVAEQRGIEPDIVPMENGLEEHIVSVAEAVRSKSAGESILVVGHSNTIPSIVRALTGIEIDPIEDDEYSRIIILVTDPDGRTRMVQAAFD